MELQVIPKYVDEIIITNNTKKNVSLIQATGNTFDESGECFLTMEFYDGIAYDVNGSGLILRYPKLSELSAKQQSRICEYIGIDDDSLNQFDVALKYGVLELSKDENDKVIHTTLHDQNLKEETMILMAGDVFYDIYNLSDDHMDYNRVVRIIRELAKEFEEELDWKGDENEDRDYIIELEKFEKKALETLKRQINTNSRFD